MPSDPFTPGSRHELHAHNTSFGSEALLVDELNAQDSLPSDELLLSPSTPDRRSKTNEELRKIVMDQYSLDQALNKIQELEAQNEALVQEHEEKLQALAEQHKVEVGVLESEIENLNHTLHSSDRAITSIDVSNAYASATEKQLRRELDVCKVREEDAMNRVRDANAAAAKSHERADKLRQQVREYRSKVEDLERLLLVNDEKSGEESTRLKRKVTKLEADLEHMRQQHEEEVEKIHSLFSEEMSITDGHRRMNVDQSKRLRELEFQNGKLSKRVTSMDQTLKDMTARCELAEHFLDREKEEKATMTRQLTKATEEWSMLKQLQEDTARERDVLANENELLKDEGASSGNGSNSEAVRLMVAQARKDQLDKDKAEVEKARREKDALQREVDRLRREIADLKSKSPSSVLPRDARATISVLEEELRDARSDKEKAERKVLAMRRRGRRSQSGASPDGMGGVLPWLSTATSLDLDEDDLDSPRYVSDDEDLFLDDGKDELPPFSYAAFAAATAEFVDFATRGYRGLLLYAFFLLIIAFAIHRSMGSPISNMLPVPLEIVELLLVLMNLVSFALVALVSSTDRLEKIPRNDPSGGKPKLISATPHTPLHDTDSAL